MSRHLLFYEKAAAVSAQRHGKWSLGPIDNYGFAAQANAVPVVLAEFSALLPEYVIVFVEAGDNVQPMAILGVKPDENLYVDAKGSWNASYIPGFVRRYPFVFAGLPDGDRLALCLDEAHSGWNKDGKGERLFDAKGERTPFLQRALEFAEDYHRQFELTLSFGRKLKELELLEPVAARLRLPGGEKAELGGFKAVGREKLKSLPGVELEKLVKSEAMELIYLQMVSMRNLNLLLQKLPMDGSARARQASTKSSSAKTAAPKQAAAAQAKRPAAKKKAPAKAKKPAAGKAKPGASPGKKS